MPEQTELQELIRPTGFYRQEAGYLQQSCQAIVTQHNGDVPSDMDDLLALNGAARKAAIVVLGVALGKIVGRHDGKMVLCRFAFLLTLAALYL